jgi:hypothetical protein
VKFGVHFGALCAPIKKQLPSLRAKDARRFQFIADAITALTIHGFLSESETHRMRQKLMQQIGDALPQEASKL